ncbi:MAG TPA: hypothetical protein EYP98_07330, partial [Planctomycetes bacterium]|nr:hypothetical protein [Planctomycetota bacterium]
GAKVSGQKFYYLKNQAVFLELALAQYALKLLQEEGLLVAIPERDTLWIGPEEGQNLEQLMAVTEQISDRSQYPVSPSLFRVKDGRLQPVQESNCLRPMSHLGR